MQTGALVRVVVLVATVSLLAGCRPKLRPAAPPAGFTPLEISHQEPSWITVGLRANLQPVFDEIEQSIPLTIGPDDAWSNGDGFDFKFKIERRPFRISMQGNQLRLSSEIAYAVRVRRGVHMRQCGCNDESWCGGNDESRRRMTVAIRSTLDWDPAWRLRAHTETLPNEPHNRCEFHLIPIVWEVDATNDINKKFREKINDVARSKFDLKIGKVTDVRSKVESIWKALFEAQKLSDSPQSWLQVRPSRIIAAPLHGSGTTVDTSFAVVAQPLITVGGKPEAVIPALPSLETGAPGETFHVAVRVEVPYDDAAAILKRFFDGRRMPATGKRYLYVKNVRVYGSEKKNHVVIRVDVDGAAQGALFLEGSLVFNVATHEIMVDKLDYTVETSSELVKIADWFGHDYFREQMKRAGRVSVRDAIKKAKTALEQSLNRELADGIRMNGATTAVRPIGIGFDDSAIVVGLTLDGWAKVVID